MRVEERGEIGGANGTVDGAEAGALSHVVSRQAGGGQLREYQLSVPDDGREVRPFEK
jgi:hypothetical protein